MKSIQSNMRPIHTRLLHDAMQCNVMQCNAMRPCMVDGCAIIINVIEWSALCLGVLETDMEVCMQKQNGGSWDGGKSIPNSSKMPVRVNSSVPQAMTGQRAITAVSAGRDSAPKATAHICRSVCCSYTPPAPRARNLMIHDALCSRLSKW